MHWAFPLIGKPWALGAGGPQSFDCWGLVCFVQRTRFARVMPELAIRQFQSPQNIKALHSLIRRSRWHLQPAVVKEVEGDILLMRSRGGPHVGVVIDVDGSARVLHCVGSESARGSVIHSSAEDLRLTWSRFEIWRYESET